MFTTIAFSSMIKCAFFNDFVVIFNYFVKPLLQVLTENFMIDGHLD